MKFADITGQEEVKKRLIDIASSGQIPHAIMLSGKEGVGKLSLARAFARYLHCENPHDGDSCGECSACLLHDKFNFPDMHFVYPVSGTQGSRQLTSEDYREEWHSFLKDYPLAPYSEWLRHLGSESAMPQIKVNEAADIGVVMSRSNYSAERKIMIIWLPEKFIPAAANKLLKLMEEPEEGNLFILVSNNPNLILPTIYSRVQRINVPALKDEEIAGHLQKTLNMDYATAMGIARVADGSLSMAEAMTEQLGEQSEFMSLFQELMRKAYMRDVTELRKWSEDVATLKREKSVRLLTYFTRQIRENFLYNLRNPELNRMTNLEMAFSSRFSPFIHSGNVEQLMETFSKAAGDIAGNANAKIVFFDVALKVIVLLRKPNA